MGSVREAIENGVGNRRSGDRLVPVFDRDLAGYNRRATAVTVVDDVEQVSILL